MTVFQSPGYFIFQKHFLFRSLYPTSLSEEKECETKKPSNDFLHLILHHHFYITFQSFIFRPLDS